MTKIFVVDMLKFIRKELVEVYNTTDSGLVGAFCRLINCIIEENRELF